MATGERRGSARTAVVWDAIGSLLDDPPRDVLDIGGGTGGLAVRIASRGHRVAVVDPSPDALAALARRAREAGVEVVGRQGDIADLADVAAPDSADLVLCHGVLEVVEPAKALARIRDVLRPGGTLSLLVAGRHAAVVARALAGHFQHAHALLDGEDPAPRSGARPSRRFTPEEVAALLADAGFEVRATHAVRVFTDLVPGSLLDLEPGSAAALVDLERAVADRPEYLPLATQLHFLAG